MGNSYPSKIGTKLDNSVCPDYRPDGRVRPGHLTGLQNRTSDGHSNAAKIGCCMQRAVACRDSPIAMTPAGRVRGTFDARSGQKWRRSRLRHDGATLINPRNLR